MEDGVSSNLENLDRLKRWRLVLGGGTADGTGCTLGSDEARMDGALARLYGEGDEGDEKPGSKKGGMGKSRPSVARWLGDIREFFPKSVVKVMQQDALERQGLRQMLLEPELLESLSPDVHLAADLLALKDTMPAKAKDTARLVVQRVVEELERKLAEPLRAAVMGSLNRSVRNRRPKHSEIDWHRTIRANLKHYQREHKTIIPETRIGFGRKKSALRDIVLCIDQSGSMGTSVVYSGVFGAVLATLRAMQTRMVVFDTEVVDLSDKLQDPIDLLFGVQLGGGTDINRALAYCQSIIARPQETILVLVSDLYEGGNQAEMIQRAASLVGAGVQVIALLALSDDGRPSYDHQVAAAFAGMGIPSFACTPDLFPDLMAAAINKQDIGQWAAGNDMVVAK
jgi:Mg-chelatase subunit ChlD